MSRSAAVLPGIDLITNSRCITRLFQDRATGELRCPSSADLLANSPPGNGCRGKRNGFP